MTEPLGRTELLSDGQVVELDRWLYHTARVAAAGGTAATYVVARGHRVVGYYALSMSSVVDERAPSRLRRGMPDPVPVVLLARLAVATVEQGHQLGGHLLVDALRRSVRGGREFGARAVVVDAIDERAESSTGTSTSAISTVNGSGGDSATSRWPSTSDTTGECATDIATLCEGH